MKFHSYNSDTVSIQCVTKFLWELSKQIIAHYCVGLQWFLSIDSFPFSFPTPPKSKTTREKELYAVDVPVTTHKHCVLRVSVKNDLPTRKHQNHHGRFWRPLFGGAGHFFSYFFPFQDLSNYVFNELDKLGLSLAKLSKHTVVISQCWNEFWFRRKKKFKFLKGTTFSFESLGKLTYKCVKPELVITGLNVDESNSVQSLKYL